MAKYTVKSANKSGEFEGKYGTTHKYLMVLEDEQGKTVAATINQKPETPVPSGEIYGTVEESPYGPIFKKEQAGGKGGFKNDPAVQSSIEWQSARRDALDYVIAKARLLLDAGKKEDAVKELTGEHWLKVTIYAKKFGESPLLPTNKENASAGKSDDKSEQVPDEVLSEQETINLDDVEDYEQN